jgi:hypothetical protein
LIKRLEGHDVTIMREWMTKRSGSSGLHGLRWGAGAALIFWLSVVAVPMAESPCPSSVETKMGIKDAQPELPSAGHGKPEKVEKDDAKQIKERAVKQRLQTIPTPGGPVPLPYPNTSGKESVK